LTALEPLAILFEMPQKFDKTYQRSRPPRIRVPHQQKAIFTVEDQKFIGVFQRLSLTGGSTLLVKGPIPKGTLGQMTFGTVFGKVNAHIEFLHTGADGVPLAQAFGFLAMDTVSSRRFKAATEQMQDTNFSDVVQMKTPIDAALETLRESIGQLSGMLTSGRRTKSKG
jgi:hypothetical protein